MEAVSFCSAASTFARIWASRSAGTPVICAAAACVKGKKTTAQRMNEASGGQRCWEGGVCRDAGDLRRGGLQAGRQAQNVGKMWWLATLGRRSVQGHALQRPAGRQATN